MAGRDLGGIINHAKVAAYLYAQLDDPENLAAKHLAEMSKEGKDGVRAGQGFHTWSGTPETLRDFHYEKMIWLVKQMREIGSVITDEAEIPRG